MTVPSAAARIAPVLHVPSASPCATQETGHARAHSLPAVPAAAVVDERTVCELGTTTDTENRWWVCLHRGPHPSCLVGDTPGFASSSW